MRRPHAPHSRQFGSRLADEGDESARRGKAFATSIPSIYSPGRKLHKGEALFAGSHAERSDEILRRRAWRSIGLREPGFSRSVPCSFYFDAISDPGASVWIKCSAEPADTTFVDRRNESRFPCALVTRVSELDPGALPIPGELIDISESGISVLLTAQLPAGALVRIDIADAQVYGQICYTNPEASAYRTGIAVERVLLGASDLSNILRAVLDRPPQALSSHALQPVR